MTRSPAVAVLLLLAGHVALAQGVKVQIHAAGAKAKPDPLAPAKGDDEATRKIKELLRAKNVTFDFRDTPFEDVLSFVRTLLDVNIVVDPRVKAKQTLTLTVRDMNVGSALQWLLRLGGAEMEIRDGAIHVKPAERADLLQPKVGLRPGRHYRRMIGKAQFKVGDVAQVELYLYEDDLPPETREMLLKLVQASLEAQLRALAGDEPPAAAKQ